MTIIQEDIERIISTDLPWHELSGKSVLVSGAAGFLPAYMVETLIHLNRTTLCDNPIRIKVLGRESLKNKSEWWGRVQFFLQDVCSPLWATVKADYIIHAASPASPKFYKTNPIETILANTRGTENMLNAVADGGKFLYFSSGDAAHCPDLADVRSCYGESKRMGEVMCAAWKAQHGVDAKIARISHTYGPGMKMDDGRVFADFVRDIRNGGPIVMHSDGSAVRPFLYLADATIAFFTILLKGEGAYNVAGVHQNISIRQLAMRLAHQFGVKMEYQGPASALYAPSPIQIGPIPDISRLQSLGWNPATMIEEGFRRTVRSYDDPLS
jgi:UDP-glucuronate decarboxylase